MKFGAIVTEGSGKLSGHVASHDRNGAYLKSNITPLARRSSTQTVIRNRMKTLSKQWRTLSVTLRRQWNTAAKNHQSTDVFGDTHNPTGFNLFIKLNEALLSIGRPVITAPPVFSTVPLFTSMTVTAAAANLIIATNYITVPINTMMVVMATRGLSVGVSNAKKSDYRIITVLNTGVAFPNNITDEWVAIFGPYANSTGQKIFVKAYLVQRLTGLQGAIRTGVDIH